MSMRQKLNNSIIIFLFGLFTAFMGFTECGTYHQCGVHSSARYLEYAGGFIAAIGVATYIVLTAIIAVRKFADSNPKVK